MKCPKCGEVLAKRYVHDYRTDKTKEKYLCFVCDKCHYVEKNEITLYVARDSDGELSLHKRIPNKGKHVWLQKDSKNFIGWIYCELYPSLTFDDDPVEVELILKGE